MVKPPTGQETASDFPRRRRWEQGAKAQSHQQQSSDGPTIEAEVSQALFDCKRTRSLILQRFQCAHAVPLLRSSWNFYTTTTPWLHRPSNCSTCTSACGNATSWNLLRRYNLRMSSDSFNSWMRGYRSTATTFYSSAMSRHWYCGIKSEQFKHFVTASFQPCKRAILKLIMWIGLDQVSVFWSAYGRQRLHISAIYLPFVSNTILRFRSPYNRRWSSVGFGDGVNVSRLLINQVFGFQELSTWP